MRKTKYCLILGVLVLALFNANIKSSYANGLFPHGHLFQPLLADPKEPHFRMSLWYADSTLDTDLLGLVSLAETFGFVRFSDEQRTHGMQIDIAGGVFAQFDMLAKSFDLINSDFVGSLPITFRRGPISARFRIYHQSTHLGDEFLLNNVGTLSRINLTYEALELLVAYDLGDTRVYGGGEFIVHKEPDSLKRSMIHLGVDYLHGREFGTFASGDGLYVPVGGLDLKLFEQNSFSPSLSCKVGVGLFAADDLYRDRRSLRMLLNFYHGLTPFGQFIVDEVEVTGVGIEIQLNL